ncbi:hypothetical protein QN345_09710 [Cryobacterium sp. 10I1]|uniref:hypothetical protein n=1 Tax=Cryobacterium sp. MDB2-33-2 TaxID=1259179 RepID=UPI00141ABE3F|nr:MULTISPECIES: hypothetical protein [unclassified Cryobacterium]MEB0002883.1 hypothetical protein [Cryobacterium sp. RTC2.1]MEB0287855.1 hypothetical protein [Cryobacterium sp. 10S3]MEB0305585.1 hypothetical protein [Cryobacterium sp. 10I1]WPX13707.1 hypothetical protein RHM57_18970 [Cryobacterium sp. 10S3]
MVVREDVQDSVLVTVVLEFLGNTDQKRSPEPTSLRVWCNGEQAHHRSVGWIGR